MFRMKLNNNVSCETSMKVSDKYMKVNNIKILYVCTLNEFHNNNCVHNNGFVVLFMNHNIKVRVLIDFDNDNMILQQINDYDDIIDYYDIDQKINFLKLFRDISKMKKIQ